MSWIKGVKTPFKAIPVQSKPILERKRAHAETENISVVIAQLLSKGVIVTCKPTKGQFLSPIFLEPKPNKSYRLILNLAKLNEYVVTEHFKIEDHKIAMKLIHNDSFMATLDLKDAYYLIAIDKAHRKFLRFLFSGVLYEFTCLPFGLSVAPQLFTKLMKPIIYFLRNLGLKSVIYLDDFLLLGDSHSECLDNVNKTCGLLTNLGFIINYEKSQTIPSQRCKYLGFIFDSSSMTLELPENKRLAIKNMLDKVSKLRKIKIREFAKFIGSIVACCPAIAYSWLYTKTFEREKYLALKSNNDNYNAFMVLKSNQSDFNWWKSHILTGFFSLRTPEYALEIFSDASLSG